MYRLFYDGEVLHDPRDDKRRVTECKVELESNTAGTLTFKIAPAHPLFGKLQAMDTGHEVTVMDDTVEVFRGRIKSDGKDMQTVTNVTCEGQLAYLNDSVVRAYGTYASDDENWTVVKGDNIFRWYVSQHNGQSDANKQFVIGKCETGYGLTRSSTQHPTTGQEIKEKLLDALPCYIDCYMDNGERILDLLEFGGADAEQSIEFGTNLLDYATTRDASNIITDIIPTGTDNDNNAIDITSLRDGDYGSCYKEGDHVSFSAGVNLYGHITEARSYDGTTPSELLNASINDLQTSSEVIESVNIKAVDLHNVDPTVKPIRLNEWVLVSSKPHGVYQPMMCVKMTIDINDPTRTVYTFGATLPSLTSDSAMKVAQNRQRQEEMIVAAAAISVDAKAAAELATTAQMAANTAQTAANTAQSTADTAKTTADTAQGTANTAKTTADTAQTTADTAQSTADTAKTTADTATSNLSALTTRVSTAESKLTATALTTTISSALTGSNAISTTKFVMDKDGLLIKSGGLSIQNNAGTTVLSADVAGNLTFTGALNGATGTFRGALTAYNSSGKLLMQASAGRINFYDGANNVVTGYVDSDLTANTNNIRINGNGLLALSVSGTQVVGIAQNRCNIYKPILYQGALVTMPRIYAGTAVRDAGGGNSVQLISLSQINSWFGINNASAVNTAVFVSNGDGAASNAHCQDATFLGGEWWATFDRTGVTTIRINYLVVCWA
jgi:hypothetical protein